MNKKRKKLVLSRDTVRTLSLRDLNKVAGGSHWPACQSCGCESADDYCVTAVPNPTESDCICGP